MTPSTMWKIRRIYLDHIGAESARFVDVTLDLTGPGATTLDSILWMRNGGGKSTCMGLLCSLIRPHRADFLATSTTDKHLEDYVLGADTAHIVVEWGSPDGRLLITGAVYEWTGKIQPADPNRSHGQLRKSWYTYTPVPGVSDLSRIVFSTGEERLDLDRFIKGIRDMPSRHEIVVTEVQDTWLRRLSDRGLDPSLFRTIVAINATEGGIEQQFQFRKPADFVKYLLDLTVDPATADAAAKSLSESRLTISQRPTLRAEIDFCTEACTWLEQIATARDRLADGQGRAAAAHRERDRLAARLAAAVREATRQAKLHTDRVVDLTAVRGTTVAMAKTAAGNALALQRVAASHDLAEAKQRHDRLAEDVSRQRLLKDAWQILPEVAEHDRLASQITALDRQIEAAQQGAQPLLAELRRAAVQLVEALRHDRAGYEERRELAKALIAELDEQAAGHTERQGAADRELGALEASRSHLEKTFDDYTAAYRRAVAEGLLQPQESPTQAVTGSRQASAELQAETETLTPTLPKLKESFETARSVLGNLQREHDDLGRAHDTARQLREQVEAEHDQLSNEPRLTLLAQADVVDPIAEADELCRLLHVQIAKADQERLAYAVEGASDERAIAALASPDGLLPPAVDLARAMNMLLNAPRPISAVTGWQYLANAVDPSRRDEVITRAPALICGVLVYDPNDVDAAVQLLTDMGLLPDTAIVVSSTTQLQEIIDSEAAESYAVLPPAPALYDHGAAEADLRRRELARAERASADQRQTAAIHADETLARRIKDLNTLTQGRTLTALRQSEIHLGERIPALAEKIAQAESDLTAATTARDLIQARLDAIPALQAQLATRTAQLVTLAERADGAQQAHEALEALPAQLQVITQRLESAREALRLCGLRRDAAAADAQSADQHATIRSQRITEVISDHLHGIEPTPTDPTTIIDIDRAEAVYKQADDAYQRQSTASTLSLQREVFAKRVTQLVAALKANSDATGRARALLAAGGPAADATQHHRVRQEQDDSLEGLVREHTLAGAAAAQAKEALQALPRTSASFVPTYGEDPADAPAARALADQFTQTRSDLDARVKEFEEGIAAAEKSAQESTHTGELFAAARNLIAEHADDSDQDSAEPFPDTPDQAAGQANDMRKKVRAAEGELTAARQEITTTAQRVNAWAGEDRFAAVAGEVRTRFRHEAAFEELAPQAEALIGDLTVYGTNVQGRLKDADDDKDQVITVLKQLVDEALKVLRKAVSAATLPAGMGPASNRKFLHVGYRSSIVLSNEVIRDRVGRYIDDLVAQRSEIPAGSALLWHCTAAVVGADNFEAKILKPTEDMTSELEPVARMLKWSGGEKVTISLLLFCMVAKLRATLRGRNTSGLGVLPLDNPLGKASYVRFIDLQRRVAAANDIQLIFLTGVGDMKSVGRFPNIIRMRNTTRTNRTYAVVENREQTPDSVPAITTARLVRHDTIPGL